MILYLLISEPDVSACVPAVATIAPLASICVMHVCGWARACVCTCVCVSVSLSQPLPQPLPPFRHDPSVGKTPKITVTHTPFSIPHTHICAHMCTRGFKTIKTQRGEEGTELKNTKGKKKNLFSFQKTAGKIHAFTRTHKRGINTKTNTHTHTLSLSRLRWLVSACGGYQGAGTARTVPQLPAVEGKVLQEPLLLIAAHQLRSKLHGLAPPPQQHNSNNNNNSSSSSSKPEPEPRRNRQDISLHICTVCTSTVPSAAQRRNLATPPQQRHLHRPE